MGQLRMGEDEGGPRMFLDGKPVHCGDGLELLLDDGVWLPGRYETSGGKPVFYIGLDGGGRRLQAPILLPPTAVLAWPSRC